MSLMKLARIFLAFLMGLAAILSGWAQTYTVLYSFTGGVDGASPKGGLVLDAAGNLYGTTQGTNPYPYLQTTGTTAGSVFKISAGGQFTLLYNFAAGGANGAGPSGGLVRDPAGNLYGSTSGGGASTDPNCFAGGFSLPANGCGEVFRLNVSGDFSVLFSFSGKTDCWTGCAPLAPLTLDPGGNLYGATYLGGNRDCDTFRVSYKHFLLPSKCGVVFRLDSSGTETVLHRFGNARKDGDFPNPGLFLDAAGNLYGTARGGGKSGNGGGGTVFRMDTDGSETVLFMPNGGFYPNGSLIEDAAGDLFGTGNQTAFKLDAQGNFTLLAILAGNNYAPLIMDAAGKLYGATFDGGISPIPCGYYGDDTCGTVFAMDQSGNLTALYNFSGGPDGDGPYAGLVMDAAGNLYGTTAYGGTVNSNCPAGCGVVFKITP